jgi:hypothetical protein
MCVKPLGAGPADHLRQPTEQSRQGEGHLHPYREECADTGKWQQYMQQQQQQYQQQRAHELLLLFIHLVVPAAVAAA